MIDGKPIVLSRFGDNTWLFIEGPNNAGKSRKSICFETIPINYRRAVKEVIFTYLTRGRANRVRPQKSTARDLLFGIRSFIQYLERIGAPGLNGIPQMAFDNYVHEAKNLISKITKKPLQKEMLVKRFAAVEALYELSQYTNTPLKHHPWPDSSAVFLAQRTGANALHNQQSRTPLIPDEVFCAMFEKACTHIDRADYLLQLRDELAAINSSLLSTGQKERLKLEKLLALGYSDGQLGLRIELTDLRTACYIVLASTSGCRNHELANLQIGAHHKTHEEDGVIYHWMRSVSSKTYAGVCDWMIPPIGVRAIRIMERWAEPYQKQISDEIIARRKVNPQDPEIAEATKHARCLFLARHGPNAGEGCRTLGYTGWNRLIQNFIGSAGLKWKITTHQFRRKFANYAAHSKFGDLRYLKEHFKHWTMDMTLRYAMDDSWGDHFDLDLIFEVESEEALIKEEIVSRWTGEDPLSGGYGRSLKSWQRDPLNLAIFKDHSTMIKSIAESTTIRSNGHSWCTADDTACVGNTVERSRCGGCNNAVIGKEHAPMYQALYGNLQALLDCKDIGEAGIIRVNRDLKRYAEVLGDLGVNVETNLGQAT